MEKENVLDDVLLVFVLVRIRITSPQQSSSEDINKILEKLIRQTTNNGTDPLFNGEPYFPVPIDTDAEAGTPEARSGPNEGETEDKAPLQDKSGEIDKNFNMLQDLFQKDIKIKPSTERSPYGHIPAKPLSLLHDYPEIVIDHISYNNEKDNTRPKPINTNPQEPPSEQNPIKDNSGGSAYITTPKPISLPEPSPKQTFISDNTDAKSDPEVKAIVAQINKAVQDEREPNKQNDILKKILDRLPKEPKEEEPDLESRSLVSYPVPLNALSSDIGPSIPLGLLSGYLGNTRHNVIGHVSTTFVRGPILTQAWTPYRPPIVPYLTGGLLGVVRPETLQRRRLVTALVRRVVPRYTIRRTLPVFYG